MKKIVLFLTVGVALLTSCTEEKILENHLDGEKWKITSASIVGHLVLKEDATSKVVLDSTMTDADASEMIGDIFSFEKKGGKGTLTYAKVYNNNSSDDFTWSNSKDELTLTLTTTDGGTPSTEVIKFKVIEDEKKTQKWENTTVETESENGYTSTSTWVLTIGLDKQ